MEVFQSVALIRKKFHHPLYVSAVFFVCCFMIMAGIFVVSDGDPVPDDGYFHFRLAALLGSEGPAVAQNFDWIYLSRGAEAGAQYPISLYQIFLAPFSLISDGVMGLHIAIAFYISAVFAIMYYVMKKECVKYPLFFTLLSMTSSYLFARMLLGRAFVLIPSLILLEMYFAIHKKYVPLFFTVIVHVLWHQATYLFPVIIVSIVEIARYMTELKCAARNFAVACGGLFVGMMFFPGFPGSLISWLQGIFVMQEKDPNAASGSLGGVEMASKDFMTYFAGQELVLCMFIFCVGVAVFLYVAQKKMIIYDTLSKERRVWVYALFIFLLGITYGSTMLSGRFYDFVFPTLVMLCAIGVTIIDELKMITIAGHMGPWLRGMCVTVLIFMCLNTLIYVYARSNEYDYTPAKDAAEWIKDHSDGREKVYVHNWGNFSLMFFGNTKNVYSTGIEPTTLKNYDPALYWKYYNIFAHNYYCDLLRDCGDLVAKNELQIAKLDEAGKSVILKKNSEAVINSIKNDFDATFIVSDAEDFDRLLLASPELIESYQEFESEKFEGKHMRFVVYKLR